jgi:ribosome-binding protein aMBF1 (putative translation factor)
MYILLPLSNYRIKARCKNIFYKMRLQLVVIEVKGIDIKLARIKKGIRQYDLAARLGIAPSRLSEIESGRRQPSPELLEHLLKLLKGTSDR